MGTRNETYLMLAVKLDFEEITKEMNEGESSKFESLQVPYCGIKAKDTMGILVDGMNGEYAIAGLVLGVVNEDNGGFPLTVIEDNIPRDSVFKWLRETGLDTLQPKGSNIYPDLMILTHYH